MELEEIRRLTAVAASLRQQADALQASAPSTAQNLRAQAAGIENSIPDTTPIGRKTYTSDEFRNGAIVGTLFGAILMAWWKSR